MKSVLLCHPQYSNVLSLVRPLRAVNCQWVPMYPPVGYPVVTRWAGVVPKRTRLGTHHVPGYLISFLSTGIGTHLVPG